MGNTTTNLQQKVAKAKTASKINGKWVCIYCGGPHSHFYCRNSAPRPTCQWYNCKQPVANCKCTGYGIMVTKPFETYTKSIKFIIAYWSRIYSNIEGANKTDDNKNQNVMSNDIENLMIEYISQDLKRDSFIDFEERVRFHLSSDNGPCDTKYVILRRDGSAKWWKGIGEDASPNVYFASIEEGKWELSESGVVIIGTFRTDEEYVQPTVVHNKRIVFKYYTLWKCRKSFPNNG